MNEETPSLQVAVERLVKVEKDNRRLKITGGVVTAVLAAALAGVVLLPRKATTVSKVVEAEYFALVDGAGRTRISLHMTKVGGVALGMYDTRGRPRLGMNLGPDESADIFVCVGEKAFSSLHMTEKGQVTLSLSDKTNQIRLTLGLTSDGAPRLCLSGKDGKLRAALVEGQDGNPMLFLCDENEIRAQLAIPQGGPHLALYHEDSKLGALMQTNDGEPALNLYDKDGRRRSGLFLRSEGSPSLVLYDRLGNSRTSLSLDPGGKPEAFVYGDKGKSRARFLLLPDTSRLPAGLDEGGMLRASSSMTDGRPVLQFKDLEGKVIFRTP